MLWSRLELVALMLLATALGCRATSLTGTVTANGAATTPEQQLELKLNALRAHRQMLQTEIGRVYMEAYSPETPLLLDELQHRQQDVQQQIDALEGRAQEQDAQHLALSLAADFDFLQQKLDELKQQLQQLQQLDAINNGNISSKEAQRNDIKSPTQAATSSSTPTPTFTKGSSYLWRPLLAMPEISGSSTAQAPSLLRRLMSILRPNASSASTSSSSTSSASFLRGNWRNSSSNTKPKLQLISAEELLPQLQLQRQFLDDAITRLEQLDAQQKLNSKL